MQISDATKRRIKAARRVAGTGARGTSKIIDISNRVADTIVDKVGNRTSFGGNLNGDASSKRAAAREIAGAAVVAAVGIYDAMDGAAQLVLSSGSDATSQFISHKCVCILPA